MTSLTESHRHPGRLLARANEFLSGSLVSSATLLFCRVSLAGVFWRAGRSKVEDGSLLSISDSTRFLFEYEYSSVPLPTNLAMYSATYAEHLFPVLLVIGLATRLSALALLLMTITIQVFVYPQAWWSVHSLWAALAMTLLSSGGGGLSVDALILRSGPTHKAALG